MKITTTVFSIFEVIFLFAIGTLGRRLLENILSSLNMTGPMTILIRVLSVAFIIALAIFAHNRVYRLFVEKGWFIDPEKK